MGSRIGKVFAQKEIRMVMLGLDNAGKTTVLYKLKLGTLSVCTTATLGFNVESINYKKLKFTVWDVGGQDRLRPLWAQFFEGTHALIYVIDSCDHSRIEEAHKEFMSVITAPSMVNAIILVFANKNDQPHALGVEEITNAFSLDKLSHRILHVQSCSALTGDGIEAGMEWLYSQLHTP
ncbi:ADP-ribosylation factor 6 [Pelomyxa schiedti]|nr:ADP-ribosylation factor 6 [Pelomyxa schiedti]